MEPITEPHPSSSNSNYAFITHSQETLPRNLPPSIDNATLARRRRRRTSAHDQAILEEEYRDCDRPDKTKRKEITHRVQMGEKEVQIWFQNKRQSARRKAKPLLPHEIIPNALLLPPPPPLLPPPPPGRRMASSSFDFSQSFSSSQSQVRAFFSEDAHAHADGHRRSRRRASVSSGIDCASPLLLAGSFSSDVSASRGSAYLCLSDADDGDGDGDDDDDDGDLDLDLDLDEHGDEHDDEHDDNDDDNDHHHRYPSSKRQKLSTRSSPPVPSPGRRRVSHPSTYDLPEPEPEPEMTTSAHQRLQDVLLSATPTKPARNPRRTNPTTPRQPPRLLKRSSSIRLSTSLEGKATVVLDEGPEDCLPSSSFSSFSSFSTSSSFSSQIPPTPKPATATAATATATAAATATATATLHPPSSVPKRRIVDSKIWEFYCDNQAMIRSPATASSAPIPQPASAKQALSLLRLKSSPACTAFLPAPAPATQYKLTDLPRRLAASSSPTKPRKPARRIRPPAASKKHHQQQQQLPGHESDKENRPPGAPASPPMELPRRRARKKKRRAAVAAAGRRVLGEQCVGGDSGGGGGGDGELLPPVRVDEMECVENLLSLRGGTWR